MSQKERDLHKIVENYMKYLNGPLGKGVMDHLEEGESCTIESNQETLEITKVKGKAKVRILDYETNASLGDGFNS